LLDPLGEEAAPRLMKNTEEGKDLVFSSTGRVPDNSFSAIKNRIDARMQAILGGKFQPWRIHDLRRPQRLAWRPWAFQPHVIERVLKAGL
jgi:hypothetical protein